MTHKTAVSTTTSSKSHYLKAWLAELHDVKWQWVVFPGVAVSFISIVVIGTIISIYASVLSVQLQSPEATANAVADGAALIGTYGSPVVQFFVIIWVAYWVCRRQGTAVSWYGLLIGAVSGLAAAVQVAFFSGVPRQILLDATLLTFLPVPMFAGWLGARRSLSSLAGQERLYLASQAIGHAHTAQAIVQAIGVQLSSSNVNQIGLWEILLQGEGSRPTAVSLLAAWSAQSDESWQPGLQFTSDTITSLNQLEPDSSLQIKAIDLPATEKSSWQALGVRSGLIIPLVTPAGSWVGLLTVTSPTNSGMARGTARDFMTIAAQVALVLDNLRLVAQAQETAVLRERQRLAREIHDTLAQGFTSIVMHLEAAEQAIPTETAVAVQHISQAKSTARDNLGQARRVVEDLRPEVLESTPLFQAIDRVVEQWKQHSGVRATFQMTGEVQSLHPEVEVTLLRAAQEGLANVRKHAQASETQVTLSYLSDVVILDVQDNGRGFGAENGHQETAVSGGFGLVAMRQRVDELSGELIIESDPAEGTTLMVSIPIGAQPQ